MERAREFTNAGEVRREAREWNRLREKVTEETDAAEAETRGDEGEEASRRDRDKVERDGAAGDGDARTPDGDGDGGE